MRIFVSYRRRDNQYLPHDVVRHLSSEFGHGKVFLDIDSIPIGSDFDLHIRESLADVDVVLVMIGQNWQAERLADPHDLVRAELMEAFRRKKTVVPLLHSGAAMPAAHDMPPDLAWFCQRQAFEFGAPQALASDLARLSSALRAVTPAAPTDLVPQVQPAQRRSIRPNDEVDLDPVRVGTGNATAEMVRAVSHREHRLQGSDPLLKSAPNSSVVGPMLVLGCGGTGVKVLTQVRRILGQELRDLGWNGPFPKAWQLIALDTAAPGPSPDNGEPFPPDDFIRLVMSQDSTKSVEAAVTAEYRRSGKQAELDGWTNATQSISIPIAMGAGQFRSIGRMAGLTAMTRVIRGAERALEDCRSGLPALSGLGRLIDRSTTPAQLRVVVVSSLTGGTGSAVLLDACDAVVAALPGLRKIEVVMAGRHTTPDNAGRGPVNALAAISELMARRSTGVGPELVPLLVDSGPSSSSGTVVQSMAGVVSSMFTRAGLAPEVSYALSNLSTVSSEMRRPGALRTADSVCSVVRGEIDLGSNRFLDHLSVILEEEVRRQLSEGRGPGRSGSPGTDERRLADERKRLRMACGLGTRSTSAWEAGHTRHEMVLRTHTGGAPEESWTLETLAVLSDWMTSSHPSSPGEFLARLDVELRTLGELVGAAVDRDAERFAARLGIRIQRALESMVGGLGVAVAAGQMLEMHAEMAHVAEIMLTDARQYEWRRDQERTHLIPRLLEELRAAVGENEAWQQVLLQLLEVETWSFVGAARSQRAAGLLQSAAQEFVGPVAGHLQKWTRLLASARMQQVSVPHPGESVTTKETGWSGKTVIDSHDWPVLVESVLAEMRVSSVSASDRERTSFHSGQVISPLQAAGQSVVARSGLMRLPQWAPGHVIQLPETSLEQLTADVVAAIEHSGGPLGSLLAGRLVTAADEDARAFDGLGALGGRLRAFSDLLAAAAEGDSGRRAQLAADVLIECFRGIDSARWRNGEGLWRLAVAGRGRIEVVAVQLLPWIEVPSLGGWIREALAPIAQDAYLPLVWQHARCRPMAEFVPVNRATLETLVKGWVVGRLLGDVPDRSDGEPWRIVGSSSTGAPEGTPFPWPLVRAVAPGSSSVDWILALLETLPLAQVDSRVWHDAIRPYDELAQLGAHGAGFIDDWVCGRPGRSPSTVPKVEGATPNDRHKAVMRVLRSFRDSVGALESTGNARAYGTLDYAVVRMALDDLIDAIPASAPQSDDLL